MHAVRLATTFPPHLMLTWVAKKLFGTSNERAVRRMQPIVNAINALESKMQKLSDAELQAKTAGREQNMTNCRWSV